jgi:DedD protein
MEPEIRTDEAPGRELRIQGIALFVAGGALLALLFGAFWAGRWFERQMSPPARGVARDSVGNVAGEEPRADPLTFFDTLSGEGKAAEPQREARPRAAPPKAVAVAAEAPAPQGGGGPFYVQVFAGRDRRAAEEIVRSLSTRGYAVGVGSEKEGEGALLKVRVGGYATRAEAQSAADKLAREGQQGAWVTRQD